jgi:hypothetical protein
MEISVILNGYKRSKHFKRQLDAINNQTIKPKEILFWQNKGDDFDPLLTQDLTHANCNQNMGVWARFAFALMARGEYVCIFDDDTIPGPRWFENCLDTLKTHDGLLGTIGCVFESETDYLKQHRWGWATPNSETKVVDIVGHCWFFKREDLSVFWREMPDTNQTMFAGEDIHFSYMLQKYTNKKTYVPPHPPNDLSLWGSMPETAYSIGTDKAAISMNYDMGINIQYSFNNYIEKGFKILKNL